MSSSAGRAKRDREKVKRERAAQKRDKRQGVSEPGDSSEDESPVAPRVRRSQSEVLEELQLLHQRFEAKAIDFEDFEILKNELMGQLDVG